MADTQRTRAALQTLLADNVIGSISPQDVRDFLVTVMQLLADNVIGSISPQDVRDFLVTVMQEEFVNANDFWCEPLPDQLTTDRTTRGYHLYSQVISENCSMGDVVFLNSNNAWSIGNASLLSLHAVYGLATESYLANATDFKVLRRGILYNSVDAEVNRLTGYIGSPLFFASATDGSYTPTDLDGHSCILGYVLPAGVGSVQCKGKIFFKGDAWSVIGQDAN
jgi:hypothetical protein